MPLRDTLHSTVRYVWCGGGDGESGGEKKGKEERGGTSREGEGTEKGGRRKSLGER